MNTEDPPMSREEFAVLMQDHLVNNAKGLVARRERDLVHADEQLRFAKDSLHNEQVRLIRLRESFLAKAA